jgi:hypothetical protein
MLLTTLGIVWSVIDARYVHTYGSVDDRHDYDYRVIFASGNGAIAVGTFQFVERCTGQKSIRVAAVRVVTLGYCEGAFFKAHRTRKCGAVQCHSISAQYFFGDLEANRVFWGHF